MAKLKPYNPQVKCPKCGCDDVKVGYCDGCYEHGFIGEHFDRTCQRCFYGWAEKCQPTPASEPPLCACGHSKREHEVFGVCQGSECGCMGYEKPEPPKPDADQPKAAFVQASENKQPPSYLTLNSKEWANSTIWHDPEVRMVDGIDKCPACLGTGKVVRLEPVKEAIQPEAKLPTEVEALYSRLWIAIESAGHVDDATLKALMDFHIGLASLWPKAGQVPSVAVTQLVAWAEQEYPDLYNRGREIPGDFFTRLADHLSRMGQLAQGDQPVGIGQIRESEDVRQAVVKVTHDPHYHAALDHDLNRLIDIVASEAHRLGDQPQLVTAEKLAEYLREEMSHWPSPVSTMAYSAWEGLAQGILKAFPTLGQGRQPKLIERLLVQLAGCGVAALGGTKNPVKCGDYGWSQSYQDVLELRQKFDTLGSGRLTVSKEQWERLLSCATSEPTRMVAVVNIKEWLKEIGMEVAE